MSRSPLDSPTGNLADDCGRRLELVSRAANGDAVALTLLLKSDRRELCAWLARRIPAALQGAVDADDVVQDAHVEIFRHVGGFEPRASDSFERWVRTIALRKLRDLLKRHKTLKRGGGAAPAPQTARSEEDSMILLLDLMAAPGRTPSVSFARREALDAVRRALDALPEDNRRALWLVNIQGWSVAAAGAEMGRSERAVHGLCRRGMDLLRKRMSDSELFWSSSA